MFSFFFLNKNRKNEKTKGEQEHLAALTRTGIVVRSAFDSKYVQCRYAQYILTEIEMSDISVSVLDEVMQWANAWKSCILIGDK